VPQVLTSQEIDKFVDERRIYVSDQSIHDDFFVDCSVDVYWNKVMLLENNTRKPKYPTITKLLKAVLTLSQG